MTCPATVSWLGYGWETTFGTVSTSMNKAFGHGVKISNLNRKNNIEKVYQSGSKNAQVLQEKRYEGSLTAEFVLANPWFYHGVLGAVTDSATSSPFTHTFSEADDLTSISLANNIQTAAVRQAQLLGGVFNSVTISSAINELVKVRADIPFANETFSTSTSSKITESYDLYSFAHGTLELPDGSTLAQVQNFETTINNNAEMIYGQGSRIAQCAVSKQRDYSGSITMALSASADLLEKCYGASTGPADTVAESADLVLTFTNGSTGTLSRSITSTYTGVKIDEDSMPQDPSQVIMEDVSIMMRSLSVAAIDSTETAV